MKGVLDAAFEEQAPSLGIRESLLETGCRKQNAKLAVTHEDEQVIRADMGG